MRALVKKVVLVPIYILALLEKRRNKAGASEFSWINMALASVPGRLGDILRYGFYRQTIRHLGSNVHFKYGSFCQYYNCSIGDNVFFGYGNAIGQVEIGNDVVIGGYVNLISGREQHGIQRCAIPFWRQASRGRKTIVLGSNIWIGSNCCITSDIGDSCVIGAGSVVVKPTESYSIYAGNPAKKIGDVV